MTTPTLCEHGTHAWACRTCTCQVTYPTGSTFTFDHPVLSQRDHYLAGCPCSLRGLCVPHGFAGTGWEHHGICSDHDHVAPDPLRPPETDSEPSCCEYACYEDPGCACPGCEGLDRDADRGLWIGCLVVLAAFAAGLLIGWALR